MPTVPIWSGRYHLNPTSRPAHPLINPLIVTLLHARRDIYAHRLSHDARGAMADGKRRQLQTVDPETPDKKKRKREHFISSWTETFDGIGKSHRGSRFARCTYCGIDINITHGSKNDVQKHLSTSGHRAAVQASRSTPTLRSIFLPDSAREVIEAESRWAMFLAKHNVAFWLLIMLPNSSGVC